MTFRAPGAKPPQMIFDAELVDQPSAPEHDEEISTATASFSSVAPRTFLDPPTAPVAEPAKPKTRWMRSMFEMLLDPRNIQWMLIFGGGLMVLGLIIWLTSLGIFENPIVVELALAVGSLGLLGLGWFVVLKTQFRIAGQATTFLACVVLPLNLWYCHSQELLTVDQGLWIAGVVCCLLYAATVYVLRDPMFIYAVEAGVTLTAFLLLANFSLATDATTMSLTLIPLALISIHVEHAFDKGAAVFSRQEYGLPFFWSGHVQLGAALALLITCQLSNWLVQPVTEIANVGLFTNSLADRFLLVSSLWIVAGYAYFYSDIMVRRIGAYASLAAFCLVMSQITLISGLDTRAEILIILLSLTALGVAIIHRWAGTRAERLSRAFPPLVLVLSSLPVLLGIFFHFRATSGIFESFEWERETSGLFVVAMVLVAVTSRIASWIYGETNTKTSATLVFSSAAGVIVAAAGLLREMGLVAWHEQTPLLMLVPVGYLLAARLWGKQYSEQPLVWIAHTATAYILFHVCFVAIGSRSGLDATFEPPARQIVDLLLGITLFEAAVFHALATCFRRQSVNMYFAMICLCGALWELMGYTGVFSAPVYTLVYAVLGFGFLTVARVLEIESTKMYESSGRRVVRIRGKGLPAFQGGNAILMIAFLTAVQQTLARLANESGVQALSVTALAATTAISIVSIWLAPAGGWRRLYVASSAMLAGLTLLSLSVLIDLHPWQKFEIICVTIGVVLLIIGNIGRLQESDQPGDQNNLVTAGLLVGSLLSALTLLIAVIYHRFVGAVPSLYDEFTIVALSLLMLLTGISWQVRATTLIGGGVLMLYLVILIGQLAYHPQVAMGVYLAVGGGLVFAVGVALSIYRDKLIALPEKLANREGIFQVIGWR